MINVQNLVKKFGQFTAVNNISLQVNKGEVVGFLGPNGAGKSTTMKIITCFQTPTAGNVTVNNYDIHKDPLKVRESLGYLPESAPSYPDMTVLSFLKFIAQIRNFSKADCKKKIDRVIEICMLNTVLHKKIENLSKGFKQRTCFAQALIHDPEILVLDEPTDGLDPNQKHLIRNLIKSFGKEKAIILSTHILEEVDAVCDRAIIISKGEIVANGTPTDLKMNSDYYGAVSLTIGEKDSSKVKKVLEDLTLVLKVDLIEEVNSIRYLVYPKDKKSPITGIIFETAKNFGWNIQQIFTDEGRLDDVFRKLTMN